MRGPIQDSRLHWNEHCSALDQSSGPRAIPSSPEWNDCSRYLDFFLCNDRREATRACNRREREMAIPFPPCFCRTGSLTFCARRKLHGAERDVDDAAEISSDWRRGSGALPHGRHSGRTRHRRMPHSRGPSSLFPSVPNIRVRSLLPCGWTLPA